MSTDNLFGGKNRHGLYVPMTDDELETLARLAESQSFQLRIKDWGHVTGFVLERFVAATWRGNPIVTFGDKVIHFYWQMNFSAPVIPQPNWYFDIEVWALDRLMFKHRLPTEINGKPINIAAGQVIALALDIAIDQINPELIREVKPMTHGLTSRHGNMHLNQAAQKILAKTQAGERFVRDLTAQDAVTVTQRMKDETR